MLSERGAESSWVLSPKENKLRLQSQARSSTKRSTPPRAATTPGVDGVGVGPPRRPGRGSLLEPLTAVTSEPFLLPRAALPAANTRRRGTRRPGRAEGGRHKAFCPVCPVSRRTAGDRLRTGTGGVAAVRGSRAVSPRSVRGCGGCGGAAHPLHTATPSRSP